MSSGRSSDEHRPQRRGFLSDGLRISAVEIPQHARAAGVRMNLHEQARDDAGGEARTSVGQFLGRGIRAGSAIQLLLDTQLREGAR